MGPYQAPPKPHWKLLKVKHRDYRDEEGAFEVKAWISSKSGNIPNDYTHIATKKAAQDLVRDEFWDSIESYDQHYRALEADLDNLIANLNRKNPVLEDHRKAHSNIGWHQNPQAILHEVRPGLYFFNSPVEAGAHTRALLKRLEGLCHQPLKYEDEQADAVLKTLLALDIFGD